MTQMLLYTNVPTQQHLILIGWAGSSVKNLDGDVHGMYQSRIFDFEYRPR